MKATAQVTKTDEVIRKGQPTERSSDMTLQDVEVLLGDGNGDVGFTRTLRLAGGDYNAVVIGSSIHIGIRCNQDQATMGIALSTCRRMADEGTKKDLESMQRRLDVLTGRG